jgi:hypothetical protein
MERATHEAGRASLASAHTAPPTLPKPTAPNEDNVKAISAQIRRDEWDDLPVFHGTGDLTQRDCLHCGAPVPVGRKRFCSVECHRMHMSAFGTPTHPARRFEE